MNCQKFEPLLIAYTDGRATDGERAEVDRHLLACAACRERVEGFARVWSVLEEAPVPQVSEAFDARLRARLAAEPRNAWLAWLPAPRFAFATAALLLLSVWIGREPATAPEDIAAQTVSAEAESRAVKDLQTLEDLDVLIKFEALAELPSTKM